MPVQGIIDTSICGSIVRPAQDDRLEGIPPSHVSVEHPVINHVPKIYYVKHQYYGVGEKGRNIPNVSQFIAASCALIIHYLCGS